MEQSRQMTEAQIKWLERYPGWKIQINGTHYSQAGTVDAEGDFKLISPSREVDLPKDAIKVGIPV